MHPEASSQPLSVALLPTLRQDEVASMDRFATDLVHWLTGRPEVHPRMVLPSWVSVGRTGRVQRSLARFVRYPLAARTVSADVFHITDQSYAHLAAVLPLDRVVVTCHDLMPLHAAAVKASFGVRRTTEARYRFSTSFLRRVAHVACVSEATRADLIKLVKVDPRRTSVITNAVASRFRPVSDVQRTHLRAEFAPHSKLLLHVSSGFPYKNVEATLEVLARLRASGIKALLLRVGTPLTPDQKRFATGISVLSAVRELGRIDDDRLVDVYNAADALIFPSHWEGFGWPALEALACGTPTVVSTAPALLETVGDAALAAPANDAAGLTQAIANILESDDLRQSLRERGLRRAQLFGWSAAADCYVDLYRRISGKTHEHRGGRPPQGFA